MKYENHTTLQGAPIYFCMGEMVKPQQNAVDFRDMLYTDLRNATI